MSMPMLYVVKMRSARYDADCCRCFASPMPDADDASFDATSLFIIDDDDCYVVSIVYR